MLLNREALLVLDTADTSLTSLSDDLADRLSEPRGSLPERCRGERERDGSVTSSNTHKSFYCYWQSTNPKTSDVKWFLNSRDKNTATEYKTGE